MLTPSFIATQTIGLPSVISLTDDSSGSDVLIVSRKVAIVNSANQYITASGVTTAAAYTTWDYSDTTISIDCLTQDTAVNITVYWLDAGGATLYSKTILYDFSLNVQQFLYNLAANEAAEISLLQDTEYIMNTLKLMVYANNADNSVIIGGDIYASQTNLNKATYMMNNSSLFF